MKLHCATCGDKVEGSEPIYCKVCLASFVADQQRMAREAAASEVGNERGRATYFERRYEDVQQSARLWRSVSVAIIAALAVSLSAVLVYGFAN